MQRKYDAVAPSSVIPSARHEAAASAPFLAKLGLAMRTRERERRSSIVHQATGNWELGTAWCSTPTQSYDRPQSRVLKRRKVRPFMGWRRWRVDNDVDDWCFLAKSAARRVPNPFLLFHELQKEQETKEEQQQKEKKYLEAHRGKCASLSPRCLI